jgi:acyl-CoA thioester hydrolase
MRTYRLERRLSHADVDFLGELKISALLGMLEQAAVEASTAAGFDAERYTRDGRIWIIRRTRLERLVPVGGGDCLEVETHVIDFRRARSLRQYTVRRGATAVASATTDWVYCDLHTGRPVRIPEELQRAFTGGAGIPAMARAESPPATPPIEAIAYEVTAQPSQLDHVTHVNNAVYASYLEDGAFTLFAFHDWPFTRMLAAGGALRVRWLDIEYLNDALAGDHLTVRSWLPAAAALTTHPEDVPRDVQVLQTIARADGTLVMRAHGDWLWRWKPAVVGGVPAA